MENKIYLKSSVKRDLNAIDRQHRVHILEEVVSELSVNVHAGKRLKNSDYYSLRLGNYRVIYQQVSDGLLIVRIAHRKDAYRD